MPADGERVDAMILKVGAIKEFAIKPPGFDMQLATADRRIPRGLDGDVRHAIKGEVGQRVKEASARAGHTEERRGVHDSWDSRHPSSDERIRRSPTTKVT